MLRSSLDPLSLTTSLDTLVGEELSQIPILRLTPSIGVRTSKLKQSSTRSEVTFSWIVEHDGYTKSREIKTTGLGVNQHQAGYWIDLVNTKALLERNGYREALAIPQRCGLKVDVNQEYTWAVVNDMQGLLKKSSKDLKQIRKGFLSTILESSKR
jgi:hypothetical protein